MVDPATARLRVLAAELRADVARIRRSVAEIAELGLADLDATAAGRTRQYAAAALLETFYTGVEKTLLRALRAFGWREEGPSWHRDALDAASLDVPDVRPPILSSTSRADLDRYLAFRHRFRNLYLFDLAPELLQPLLRDAPHVVAEVCADFEGFAGFLVELERAAASTR